MGTRHCARARAIATESCAAALLACRSLSPSRSAAAAPRSRRQPPLRRRAARRSRRALARGAGADPVHDDDPDQPAEQRQRVHELQRVDRRPRRLRPPAGHLRHQHPLRDDNAIRRRVARNEPPRRVPVQPDHRADRPRIGPVPARIRLLARRAPGRVRSDDRLQGDGLERHGRNRSGPPALEPGVQDRLPPHQGLGRPPLGTLAASSLSAGQRTGLVPIFDSTWNYGQIAQDVDKKNRRLGAPHIGSRASRPRTRAPTAAPARSPRTSRASSTSTGTRRSFG